MENNTNNTNSNSDETESSGLKHLSRRNVFHTPEYYFVKLPVQVADSIHRNAPNRNWNMARVISLTGLAAVLIVAVSFYFTGSNFEKETSTELSYDDLLNSGMVAEMDENLLFEEYEFITSEKIISNTEIEDDAEHLKEYLIESNTDITLIINEL